VTGWQQFVDAKYITPQEKGSIIDFQGESRNDLLEEKGEFYARLFIKLLPNIHSSDVKNYLLTLVDSCMMINRRRAAAAFNRLAFPASGAKAPLAASAKEALNPYQPFMGVLQLETADFYAQARACHILSTLFANGGGVASQDELVVYLRWLIGRLRSGRGRELTTALGATKDLLKAPELRAVFVKLEGLNALTSHFRADNANTQIVYLAGFCVWLLSYQTELLSELREWNLLDKVKGILAQVTREKCLRICFAILVNVINQLDYNEQMINRQMPKVIDSLYARKMKDEDMITDMDNVKNALDEAVHQLSSFEKYAAEVDSGKLGLSPVHSEQFWRENNTRFEEKSYTYIRKLVDLLKTPDELTLMLACSDLGEFARFHPDGKRIIAQFGGKTMLMALMTDKGTPPRVQSAALLAVQKLMVSSWDLINVGSRSQKKDDA